MTAQDVLDRVLAAGGQVVRDASGPRLRTPADLRPLVEQHRDELRRLLSAAAPPPPAMPSLTAELVENFSRHGTVTEIRAPGISATLFMVPTVDDARRLMAWEGVSRGRIFTAGELRDVLAIPTRTPETWHAVMLAKVALDGDVIETRPR